MAKAKTSFVCTSCGSVHSKWMGQCPDCNTWGSISEEAANTGFSKSNASTHGKLVELYSLQGQQEQVARVDTGIAEMDRTLGGGLVPGSAVLLGGDPGIGKSTLLLQLLASLSQNGHNTLYITGEESVAQVQLRAKRLGAAAANVQLASTTNVADIITTIKKEKPLVAVIDSIQTMYIDEVGSAPGTVSQVRTSSHELVQLAKQTGTALVIVGHVTKDGQIAGPKVLEHMVDTVLYFEGDRGLQFRILRSVKNRFGPVNEIGVFEMGEGGLEEVTNPSSLFISGRQENVSGSVVFPSIEGSRTVMVEVQALVAPTTYAQPRRAVVGWDANRLNMLLAVLQTRAGLQLADKEVYLNVAGGIRVLEPAADLAVAAAIFSSLANIPIPSNKVVFGEVGLSGEVRPVGHSENRIKESAKLGFESAIMPASEKGKVASQQKSFNQQAISAISELKKLLA